MFNCILNFKAKKEEKEKLRKIATERGYWSLSRFIRAVVLKYAKSLPKLEE